MGASKDLFFELRCEETIKNTLYESGFTKKDAKITGENLVNKIFDEGNVGKLEFFSNMVRLQEVVNSAVIKLREKIEIFEKTNVMGVEFNPTNGGNSINYQEDLIWCELKKELEERTEQLKLAQKQDTFDAYGNQVPKVTTTPRKASINIKF